MIPATIRRNFKAPQNAQLPFEGESMWLMDGLFFSETIICYTISIHFNNKASTVSSKLSKKILPMIYGRDNFAFCHWQNKWNIWSRMQINTTNVLQPISLSSDCSYDNNQKCLEWNIPCNEKCYPFCFEILQHNDKLSLFHSELICYSFESQASGTWKVLQTPLDRLFATLSRFFGVHLYLV